MAIELSIRDLTLITKGKLRLGLTPPLGGEFEPIGRLLHPTDKLRKGDVVIAPLENEYFSEARKENRELEKQDWAESSFATGAFGIISTRDICPWNGCFSIQVDDLEALFGTGDFRKGNIKPTNCLTARPTGRFAHCENDAGIRSQRKRRSVLGLAAF